VRIPKIGVATITETGEPGKRPLQAFHFRAHGLFDLGFDLLPFAARQFSF